MNLKEIKEIIALMNENELAEIEIEREGAKIKIKKTLEASSVMMGPPVASQPYRVESQASPAPAPADKTAPAVSGNAKSITSPMVGTFYRAPSPESPPFVEMGQIIEVGQVVCIVEAMKLMNEIKSEFKGKIVQIPVENAEPVEFGQPLFVIEPV